MRPQYEKRLRESYKEVNYRSIYLPVMRAGLPEMLKAFDAPDPSLVVGRRDVTTVASQSLVLMNDPFVVEQARRSAQRIVTHHNETQQRTRFAYRLILGRDPTSDEQALVQRFLADKTASADELAGWTRVCHVLMATGEFRTLY